MTTIELLKEQLRNMKNLTPDELLHVSLHTVVANQSVVMGAQLAILERLDAIEGRIDHRSERLGDKLDKIEAKIGYYAGE